LTYTLLFLEEGGALLGEVALLLTAGVVLTLVGEVVFVLVVILFLAGVDFDGVAGGFFVVEGTTRGFFGLSRMGLEILI
jgi:hypothetical protein